MFEAHPHCFLVILCDIPRFVGIPLEWLASRSPHLYILVSYNHLADVMVIAWINTNNAGSGYIRSGIRWRIKVVRWVIGFSTDELFQEVLQMASPRSLILNPKNVQIISAIMVQSRWLRHATDHTSHCHLDVPGNVGDHVFGEQLDGLFNIYIYYI